MAMATTTMMTILTVTNNKEEEASQMIPPLPRKKMEAAATNDAPATFTMTVRNNNDYNNSKSKRRRRYSFSNLRPLNIPAPSERTGISANNRKDGREYLPMLKVNEAQKKAELVHRLQQQIRKLEKELATKMKEEKAKNDASSWSSFAGRNRKSCSM